MTEESKTLEPILEPNIARFVSTLNGYPQLARLYEKARDSFWVAAEVQLDKDPEDWAKLNKNEQQFLAYILAFFLASDGIVMENLAANFLTEVQIPEARAFYAMQIAIEQIHSETYRILLETYIQDKAEREKLFRAVETIPCIKQKADFAQKWMDPKTRSFGERLIAFAAVEGIFFSGSFCAIFWIKKRGLLPGLNFANDQISKDEGLHTIFACTLLKLLENKPSEEVALQIIQEAVEIEHSFNCESLPVEMLGMNANLMKRYIMFVADHLLLCLGYSKHYKVENPFDFMEMISLDNLSNFFEKRVGEYAKVGHNKHKLELENGDDPSATNKRRDNTFELTDNF